MKRKLNYSEIFRRQEEELQSLNESVQRVNDQISSILRKENGAPISHNNMDYYFVPSQYRWAAWGGQVRVLGITEDEVRVEKYFPNRWQGHKADRTEFRVPRSEFHLSDWERGKLVRAAVRELKADQTTRWLINSQRNLKKFREEKTFLEARIAGMEEHIRGLRKKQYQENVEKRNAEKNNGS